MLYLKCPNCKNILGNKQIPFEEKLKQKNQKVMIAKSIIASALYLISGETDYEFQNLFGNNQRYIPSDKLIKAKKIIQKPKDVNRNLYELKILDSIFRYEE